MLPQAPYQLPQAYIIRWGRSLTSPVSEAGLSPPKHPQPASPPTTGTSEKSPNSPLPYRIASEEQYWIQGQSASHAADCSALGTAQVLGDGPFFVSARVLNWPHGIA